jgi:hypothetical protein
LFTVDALLDRFEAAVAPVVAGRDEADVHAARATVRG